MNGMKSVVMAENRKAKMVILRNEKKRPADILKNYLKKITGAEFSICTVKSITPAIILKTQDHGIDGFSYYIENENIVIEAKTEEAMVFAVYDFLERVIGCRYYTPDCEKIPFDANLEVCFEDYSYTPPLQFREILYDDYKDPEFCEKHKMSSPEYKKEVWGFFCHSFKDLCPADIYYEKHPEYFSFRNGERIREDGQLCLSNPEVLKVVVENLKKEIKKKPKALYWSVSQNDNNVYCQCEACKAQDERDESPMGSVLNFVNQVAEQFPDKIISTLAYWYTRKVPKITRPRENVHILLCNIEANRGAPIEIDERSKESKEELLAWKEICKNVFLWDYCIQFRNLVSPFPNLEVLAPNIRFFVENNVTSLFSQCNREIGGEFYELRGYLLAKLMWNPKLEYEDILDDFLTGYYHQAAPYIKTYIETLHRENTEKRLNIFGGPEDGRNSYLSAENYKKYEQLFEQALEAVKEDEDAAYRVYTARLPLLYAGIVLKYGTKQEQMERIGSFIDQARRVGLEKVEEWKITTDKFIADSIAALHRM